MQTKLIVASVAVALTATAASFMAVGQQRGESGLREPRHQTRVSDFRNLGAMNAPRSQPERCELRLDLGGGVTLHLVRG